MRRQELKFKLTALIMTGAMCFMTISLISCAKKAPVYSEESSVIEESEADSSLSDETSLLPDETITTHTNVNSADTTAQAEITASETSESETTKRRRVSTTISAEEVNTDYQSKNSSVGFGFYHLKPDSGITPDFEKLAQSNFINTFLISDSDHKVVSQTLQAAKKYNCQVWISVEYIFKRSSGAGSEAVLNADYKSTIDNAVKYIQLTGCYDQWLGFYFDEPELMLVTNDMLNTVTEYMHEVAPGKRIFICFSIAGIDAKTWTITGAEEINKTGSRYLTDAAFDLYGRFDKAEYFRLTQCMKDKMYNQNVKIWYVPGTMIVNGITSEQMAVDHFNGLVDLLKDEQNPGGIMNFAYHFVGGDTKCTGLSEFVSFFDGCGSSTTWHTMKGCIETVGREICTGDMFKK